MRILDNLKRLYYIKLLNTMINFFLPVQFSSVSVQYFPSFNSETTKFLLYSKFFVYVCCCHVVVGPKFLLWSITIVFSLCVGKSKTKLGSTFVSNSTLSDAICRSYKRALRIAQQCRPIHSARYVQYCLIHMCLCTT